MIRNGSKVTIRDIAKIAGVSPSTVSLVLNAKGNINAKTRRKIENIAKKMNYHPSPMARWLRGSKTFSIGVIVDHLHNQHFINVFKGIEEITDAAGYSFLVAETHEEMDREIRQLKNLADRGVDGIIMIPCSENSAHIKAVQEEYGIPVVLIGNYLEEDPYFFSVVADNWSGSRMVAEHLLSLNRHPILCIACEKKQSKLIMRRRGFEVFLHEKTGKTFDRDHLFYVEKLSPSEGDRVMKVILKKHSPPFSIFVANDNTALGVINCCREKNLKIPEVVSVAGFAGINMAGQLDIPLTTVQIPALEMGKKAAALLLECIEQPSKLKNPERIVLPVSLVIRKSTSIN